MAQKIAIIGVGPRGVSVIDRIGAAGPSSPLELHLIDDAQLGAGRIWDTEQTRTLCMNTLADAVTLFTEPGSTVTAPVRVGPTMFEWIKLARGEALLANETSESKEDLFKRFPAQLDASYQEELAKTRPESNPSRALYGEYIRWCFRVFLDLLPEHVTVVEHSARAVKITPAEKDPFDLIELSDGSQVQAHATIIANGWTKPELNPEEIMLSEASGIWIAPDNPVEQKVEALPASGKVLVRGMGMGFFDLMALLTFDRGGRYVEDDTARSGLRYEASGKEPHLFVSSGRGYPYLPKSDYKSLPPKPKVGRLKAVIENLKDADRIDFGLEVWPAIVKDAYEDYYRVLAQQKPQALAIPIDQLIEIIDQSTSDTIEANLASHVKDPTDRFSLGMWRRPLEGIDESIAELTQRIGEGLHRDIAEAVAARKSALKSGLWSLSASRKPAMILGSEGRYTWKSRVGPYKEFMGIGQMAGSGPPLFRTRQLLALVDAGIVSFLGDRPSVQVEEDHFVMFSPTTGEKVKSSYLVDAWMHQPDIRHTADPLFASLQNRLRPFQELEENGLPVDTGSPEVHPISRALIHPDGREDPRVMVIGIPTYAQMPDTTISPMPGTDPLMLQETDKAAMNALKVSGVLHG